MLNKQTLAIIRGISEVTNSAVIEYPITTLNNITGDIKGTVDFSKVSEPFNTFGIWDLGSFLGAISVLESPIITLNNNIILAQDEYSKIDYVTSSPSILEDYVCDPDIISSTLSIESIVDSEIDTDTINRIKKGVNVFKNLKDLEFSKTGKEFKVKTTNKESFNSSQNGFTLKLDTTKIEGDDFKVAIPAENFLTLPSMDYSMSVREKNGQYRISMINEIFSFVLSLKK